MALTIRFSNDTKKFTIGSTNSGQSGTLRISFNDVVFYDNFGGGTNDIVAGAANTNPSIKTDTAGNIAKGVYKFEFDTDASGTANETELVDFLINPLSFCLDLSYDCFLPNITATDSTSYATVSNATVSSASRTLSLIYPNGSGVATQTASAADTTTQLTLSKSDLWTEAYQSTVTGNVLYSVTDSRAAYSDFTYYEEIDAYDTTTVVCNNDLCDIYCCLNGLYEKIVSYTNNNRDTNNLKTDYMYASSLIAQYREAIQCNKTSSAASLLSKIKEVLNCDGCGCDDCNDEAPKRVYGVGNASGGGTALSVTDGTTTVADTSTLSFSDVWFDVTNPISGEAAVNFSGASATALIASASTSLTQSTANSSSISSISSTVSTNSSNISSLSGNVTTLLTNYNIVEYEITGFDSLATTPELVLSVPANRAIIVHSAILKFADTIGTPSTSPRIYLHTSSAYSTNTELAQTALNSANVLGVGEYAQFSDTIGSNRRHVLGEDLYVSASTDPTDWTPGTAILTVCYAIN